MNRINRGYEDTCRILESVYKIDITQKKFSFTAERMLDDELNTKQKLALLDKEKKEIYNERERLKRELEEAIKF